MSKQKVLCCVEQMVLKKSAVLVVQETNLVEIKLLPVSKAISVSTYKHLFGFIYETSLFCFFKFISRISISTFQLAEIRFIY